MNLLNKIKIKLSSNEVGVDEFGNSYFEEKNAINGKKRRFVVYKGCAEPSKVPSRWHRWLHYTCDEAPINIDTHQNPWQKTHLPNLTGTIHQHSPASSAVKKGNRKKVGADYQSWTPDNN